MTARDIYSLIDRIIQDGKRRINARDREIIDQLLGAYQDARHTIATELTLLEQQILWSVHSNQAELTEAWVRRQAFFERLDGTIIRESVRLEAKVRDLTVSGRYAGITEGGVTGRATIQAIPWGGLNPRAVENWISAIQPGSPLDRVLARYGTDVEATLRREITQGIIQGRGSTNTVGAILANVGESIPPSNASRIVRTEMMRSYRGVYQDQMDSLPKQMIAGYRWVSALDFRTCPICMGLHGQVFKEYPNYFHVQCFPAGTEVNGPLARKATKRWYEGELVEITTAGNKRLSVTPNHPILTPRGWIPAGELVEGDNVIRHIDPEGPSAAINPDYKGGPTFIEQVSESLMDSGDGVSSHVPGTPVDFHGDGAHGQVDVVLADSFLGGTGNAAVRQPFSQEEFIRSGIREILLAGKSRALQNLDRAFRTSHSIVRSTSQLLTLFGSGLSHAGIHGFGSSPGINPGICELHADALSSRPEPLGDRLLGHPRLVPASNFAGGRGKWLSKAKSSLARSYNRSLLIGAKNPSVSDNALESVVSDSELASTLIERYAGDVSLDRIVDVSISSFSGHVYNLETVEGWYSANGIITHNCRCTVSLVFSERYAPPREFQTGDDWFAQQSPEYQRSVLGPGRYDVYSEGTPLSKMVRFEKDPVWGGSSRLIPVKELRR